jgi:hypothetical protein
MHDCESLARDVMAWRIREIKKHLLPLLPKGERAGARGIAVVKRLA